MSGPGSFLYRVAGSLCGPRTIVRLIDPWLADYRFEYGTTAFGRTRRAWVRIVHVIALARLLVVGVLTADTASTTRLTAWITGCTGVTTFVFTVPFQTQWAGRPQMYPLIIPSALAVGVPFGAALGTALAVRPGRVTKELRALAIGIALFSAIGNGLVTSVWLPRANQAFRVEAFRLVSGKPHATLLKGPNELTLVELRNEIQRLERSGASNLNTMRIIFQSRVALAVLPVTLVLSSFVLAGRHGLGWLLALIAIVLVSVCFLFLSSQVRHGDTPLLVGLAVWLPTLLPLAIARAARLGGVTEALAS